MLTEGNNDIQISFVGIKAVLARYLASELEAGLQCRRVMERGSSERTSVAATIKESCRPQPWRWRLNGGESGQEPPNTER